MDERSSSCQQCDKCGASDTFKDDTARFSFLDVELDIGGRFVYPITDRACFSPGYYRGYFAPITSGLTNVKYIQATDEQPWIQHVWQLTKSLEASGNHVEQRLENQAYELKLLDGQAVITFCHTLSKVERKPITDYISTILLLNSAAISTDFSLLGYLRRWPLGLPFPTDILGEFN
ncbi:hypothetical protein HOY82DRAFT_602441 [Tuber indicum]|nr:hypothetical protein HOY82DRAFT_602441 [Tuber indicum]